MTPAPRRSRAPRRSEAIDGLTDEEKDARIAELEAQLEKMWIQQAALEVADEREEKIKS
jgi:hypothetical protein